jgi:hypothetical protein
MMLAVQSHYHELCKRIIQLDPKIRFTGIINDNGRLVTGAAKEEITFFVEEKDREMLFMETALRTRMLGDFDSCLGTVDFSIYHRKNVVMMEFPIDNVTVYVSSEKDIDLNEVSFMISTLLRRDDTASFGTQDSQLSIPLNSKEIKQEC